MVNFELNIMAFVCWWIFKKKWSAIFHLNSLLWFHVVMFMSATRCLPSSTIYCSTFFTWTQMFIHKQQNVGINKNGDVASPVTFISYHVPSTRIWSDETRGEENMLTKLPFTKLCEFRLVHICSICLALFLCGDLLPDELKDALFLRSAAHLRICHHRGVKHIIIPEAPPVWLHNTNNRLYAKNTI